MKYYFIKNKINFLFLFISFFYLILIIGVDNISFQSTGWLHAGNDRTLPQLGWHFFKNDIWRFPLGSNPNYGDELGSSIIFADTIPILALIFKMFRSLIPDNFQYISLWYFICFYLQLFFSFKIIKKFTNSVPYSLVGSFFFLIAPIFVIKLATIPALAGQWTLLIALYLGLSKKIDQAKWPWFFLIILSSLINFYFMIMIIAAYSLLRIFNFRFDKINIIKFIKDFIFITTFLLLILYVVGYFQVRMADTMALGFGRDKLNLLSIFDSANNIDNFRWSWFLPDIKLDMFQEYEGFNYFGLGQIILVLFALLLFFNKNYKINLQSIKNNKNIKKFFFISIFFTIWALSNKISLGPYTLLEIPLNKYIYGLLSIVRPTGRLFWIVSYFLLILSIIIIYQCFDKRKSLIILFSFLLIQIADTSIGIKQCMNSLIVNDSAHVKDQLWKDLFGKYKIIKNTYPRNYAGAFSKFSYSIEKNNIIKTNLVKLARISREEVAKAKYDLYENFSKKILSENTIYIVNSLGHLKHLKYIFKNENVGFFYRDDVWAMVLNEKDRMNDNDKKAFNEIKPNLIKIDENKTFHFGGNKNYYGFGWSHNLGKPGIWSEGPMSTLFFRTDKNYGDLKLEIICMPHITKKNNVLEFDIYVNNKLYESFELTNGDQDKKLQILIERKLINNNKIKIDFRFKNPISPHEVLESPDSRKLGLLLKNLTISAI